MQKVINIIKNTIQNKQYLFLAIPFGVILLFIFLTILLFQNSPEQKQKNMPSITPINSPTLTIPTTSNPTPTTRILTPEDPEFQQKMEEQSRTEQEFADEQAGLIRDYPWYESMPLQTDSYFVYFDLDKKTFTGYLYPKQSASQPIDIQVIALKTQILNSLEGLGINTTQYPVIWQITPEP